MSARGGGRGGGRGEYYKNKYGRGRGGGRGGRGGRGGGQAVQSETRRRPTGGSSNDLSRLLNQLDGRQYPGYHDLETSWEFPDFTLSVGRAQSDPFAPPTRCRLVVPATTSAFDQSLYSNKVRATALADYLHRALFAHCREMGADAAFEGKGWSGPKGGDISISEPCQHVLQQSATQVSATGDVTAQLTINLPARGRTILGRAAEQILCQTLPSLVNKALKASSLQLARLNHHVDSVEDQVWLQKELDAHNLIAFVRSGAILPRASGVDDRPIDTASAVPFTSPDSLKMSFTLPNAGTTIEGMGIRKGITLICGGGFHGKSTLLEAIQLGVYPKIPGDGREFCVSNESAMKIRAEDGRQVSSVDISPFIDNLPFGKDTTCFSTEDASGSTSQASNIIEAIEVGTTCLILDDDTCATNFMHRGMKMQLLVASEKEPITPFVQKIRAIYNERSVSSVLVMGGSGDFFDVADTVIMMDSYKCLDVTEKAKAIAAEHASSSPSLPFGNLKTRYLNGKSYGLDGKSKTLSETSVSYGSVNLDLSGMEQIVTKMQTNSIVPILQKVAELGASGQKTIVQVIAELNEVLDNQGLDALGSQHAYNGSLSRPRTLEIAAAVNRLRRQNTIYQKK